MTLFEQVYRLARQVQLHENFGEWEQASQLEGKVLALCSGFSDQDWDCYVDYCNARESK